jgi:hypothetical protein
MISVAPTGRIHEHTRPIFKTLLKSLASAGPSIHGAFDKPILHRLAGCDPNLILPGQYGVRGAGAVAADDHARTSPYLDDVVKCTRHAHSGERGVHDQTHAFRVKSSTTVRMRKRRPMTTYPSRSRATSADSDPAGSLSAPESQVPVCGHRNGDGCAGPP